jgi:hypothetical protein
MKKTLALFAGSAVALLAAGTALSSAAGPQPVALSATPTIVTLLGTSTSQIHVVNPSHRAITVAVATGNYAIASNGRVQIDPKVAPNRTAKAWLSITPATLKLGPNGEGNVTVVSHPPKKAEPGDHHALVLLTARAAESGQVAIRTRIGVGVLVRMPGSIVRKLAIPSLRVKAAGKAKLLNLAVANLGNVNERLAPGKLTIQLSRAGKSLTVLRTRPVDLLPASRQTVSVPYRGKVHGTLRAVVRVRPTPASEDGPGIGQTLAPVTRTFSVRL